MDQHMDPPSADIDTSDSPMRPSQSDNIGMKSLKRKRDADLTSSFEKDLKDHLVNKLPQTFTSDVDALTDLVTSVRRLVEGNIRASENSVSNSTVWVS